MELARIYYDPETGFVGARQLYLNAGKKYTMRQVREWLKKQEIGQVFGKVEKLYHSIVAYGPHEYQMDLTFYNQYKKVNDGYGTLLVIIEISSRKLYVYPTKTKRMGDIRKAFEKFIEKAPAMPKKITSDNEASFIKILKDYPKIKHFLTRPGNKTTTSIVERVNRTIRERLSKYLKANRTKRWIDVIEKIVRNYNNSVHSSIKMKPNKVRVKDIRRIIFEGRIRNEKADKAFESYRVGDTVRVLKKKALFSKGGDLFSRGLYTIIDKSGYTLVVKKGNNIHYKKHWELMKIDEVENKVNEKVHSTKQIRKENTFNRLQHKEPEVGKRMVPKDRKRKIKKPTVMNL